MFNYLIFGILALVFIFIYLSDHRRSEKKLDYYCILGLFLAAGSGLLGYIYAAYFFGGAAAFLWFFGDKLKFK